MKIKQGMILAAGMGKRMQPITLKTPKPLIQIGNKNLLDRAIEFLVKNDVDENIELDDDEKVEVKEKFKNNSKNTEDLKRANFFNNNDNIHFCLC